MKPTEFETDLEYIVCNWDIKDNDHIEAIFDEADKYGVSAERIRQIEKAAMEKVKSYIS